SGKTGSTSVMRRSSNPVCRSWIPTIICGTARAIAICSKDLLADIGSGHNIRATLFEECGAMYRSGGPPELRSLGETEFANGVARMSASGKYGPTRCCSGIIGNVDLRIGFRAKAVLEQHMAVSDGRLRGIRNSSAWPGDPSLKIYSPAPQSLLVDKSFREGFAALAVLGLTFDAWMFQT